ncbi:hypothetical protein JP0009_22830 [Helicobacter pylori]
MGAFYFNRRNDMEFKFKQTEETTYSTDPYYDLTIGGYIKPSELLADAEQIKQVEQAIQIVYEFLEQAESNGVLEVC